MYYLQLTMSPWSVTFQDYVSSLIRKKWNIAYFSYLGSKFNWTGYMRFFFCTKISCNLSTPFYVFNICSIINTPFFYWVILKSPSTF